MAEAADAPAVDELPEAKPRVILDTSEPVEMLALLLREGIEVERQRLAPADYLVGPIAIERKSVADFHASMIDKRLFEQLGRLKETYPTCALVLEGDPSFFASRQSPRASWGALCSIAFDFDVAVIPTPDRASTAELLAVLARRVVRERDGSGRGEVRYKPRLLGPQAEQRFAVQGLPRIGDIVSEALLEHFGSVRRVFAASEKELFRVPGVGKGRARDITAFLDRPFEGRQRRLPPP